MEASTPGRIKSARNVIDDGSLADGESLNSNSRFVSGRFLEDASFLRCQNITLGYNFNFNASKYISSLRAFISVDNVFTITRYSGYDPESIMRIGNQNSVPVYGIDFNSYPIARTVTLGLSVDF